MSPAAAATQTDLPIPKRTATALTDAFVRGAKAKRGERTAYFDAQVAGLELRVSPAGVKAWAYRYRDDAGRSVRFALGQFPAVKLKDARAAALDARRRRSQGGDPHREKQAAVAATRAQKVRTVRDLAAAYLDIAATRNRASSIEVDRQRITTHILPKLGAQPIGAVTRAQVRELINAIGRGGHRVTANRVGAMLVKLYHFAQKDLDIKVENPAMGLQSTYDEQSRTRVFSDAELGAIWNALEDWEISPLSEPMALCTKLCALTLQRAKEVAEIDLSEIDLEQKLWVVPGARTKNHLEHVVPLSAEAVAVIKRAMMLLPPVVDLRRGNFGPLFPSPRDPRMPITRHAVTRAMTRLFEMLGIDDARLHDLRRTGATNITAERIGIPRFVVSAALNHISEMGGVTGIYDRNEYLPDKRRALDAWAKLLVAIASRQPRVGNVVAIPKRKRQPR